MSLAPGAVSGQAQASLGAGVGSVRYPGGSRFATVALSPVFELEAPDVALTIGGSIASLPAGIWSSQGRADLWGSTPSVGGVRLALEGIGAGVTRTDGAWSSEAYGLAEVLWSARNGGVAVGGGPAAGWVVNDSQVTAFHGRGRAWWRNGAALYAVNVEPTRFLGAWFTDVSAGISLDINRVSASLWGGARLSAAYGSKGAGSAMIQYFALPNLAIEVGGGSYLPDPYQELPRAGYVTAGIRLFARHRSTPTRPATPVWPPLAPPRRGDSVVVRIRMEGAQAVAISGDWDNWGIHPMHPLGGGIWEWALKLTTGTYRFDLQVNGRDWVVPDGVALIKDRDGGMLALLVVR
ncbi:MAG TPA: glycogen-binding domain-containing protein [Gemmatimonadales bacterium]|nr:glycogen-binding domain-containing protein [Gemmatimonadales bacterium]